MIFETSHVLNIACTKNRIVAKSPPSKNSIKLGRAYKKASISPRRVFGARERESRQQKKSPFFIAPSPKYYVKKRKEPRQAFKQFRKAKNFSKNAEALFR